jgi:hypothetical protein
MQPQDSRSIMADINGHIQKSGKANSQWYVGITADIEKRLFGDHQVPRENHWYIYRRALNANEARNIEAAYHTAGCQGAGGGGDDTAVYVYAYVVTAQTRE